jgi:hypothetical protein
MGNVIEKFPDTTTPGFWIGMMWMNQETDQWEQVWISTPGEPWISEYKNMYVSTAIEWLDALAEKIKNSHE